MVDSRIRAFPLCQVELNNTNLPAVCMQNSLMTELSSLNKGLWSDITSLFLYRETASQYLWKEEKWFC